MFKCSLLFPGDCNSYRFNITNDEGKYKVRMNQTVKNITMWFFPKGSQCLPSQVLNSAGTHPRIIYHTCKTTYLWTYFPSICVCMHDLCCQWQWRHCWLDFEFWTLRQSTKGKNRTYIRLKDCIVKSGYLTWLQSIYKSNYLNEVCVFVVL